MYLPNIIIKTVNYQFTKSRHKKKRKYILCTSTVQYYKKERMINMLKKNKRNSLGFPHPFWLIPNIACYTLLVNNILIIFDVFYDCVLGCFDFGVYYVLFEHHLVDHRFAFHQILLV